jgi:predicted acylesterase/phospholipase RssA
MTFTSIVIAGGAFKVLATIGCIKYLEERNMIASIKNYVGTSAGAMMCFFLVLGYKSQDITDFITENIHDDNICTFDIEGIFNFFSTYGVCDGKNLTTFFERILYKKHKLKDITFMEVAKRLGKNLVVAVSNLTKEQTEYFSVDTVPDMSVIFALRISCSIPFVFTPVSYKDQLYVDGGLYQNFPIKYFSGPSLKDIIGINILAKDYQNTSDFMGFSLFILQSILSKLGNDQESCKDRNIINISIEDKSWFSFETMKVSVTNEQIFNYIDYGYKLIKESIPPHT